MIVLNVLTYNVAYELASYSRMDLIRFINDANKDFLFFTHFNYFYLYAKGNVSSFHRVHTKCAACNNMPERNDIGVGTIWLMRPDDKGRMKLLCNDCKKRNV